MKKVLFTILKKYITRRMIDEIVVVAVNVCILNRPSSYLDLENRHHIHIGMHVWYNVYFLYAYRD